MLLLSFCATLVFLRSLVFLCYSFLSVLLLSFCATLAFLRHSCLSVPLLSFCATLVFLCYSSPSLLISSFFATLVFLCCYCPSLLLLSSFATLVFPCYSCLRYQVRDTKYLVPSTRYHMSTLLRSSQPSEGQGETVECRGPAQLWGATARAKL